MAHVKTLSIRIVTLIMAVLFTQYVHASGLLKPKNSQYQDLVIKQHHVEVVIEDTYATTTIEQEFYNPNNTELEAIYSFPVPKEAVVGEFIYWINGQPVIAEAVRKEQARKIYDDQKQQGRSTAITEKDSYKAFNMSVFPVLPQQSVKVRLVYMQNELIDHGVGRYVYPMEEGGVDEVQEAFWSRNNVVESDFSFELKVRSGYPVDGIRLPKHPQAAIVQDSAGEWSTNIGNQVAEEASANAQSQPYAFRLDQDIVVYWRLADGLPGRLDMVTYRDPSVSNKGTFKLTFTPGDDLTPVNAERDWVFVLDNSGSMEGKYSTLVEGVRQGLGKLPANDRFKIVTFNSSAADITGGFIPVTPENVEKMLKSVEQQGVGGGTNLYAGMKIGLDDLDADRPAGIILVTDGVANVGATEKKDFLKLLNKYDVRLFTFIMGNSANEPLLQAMTKVSNGFAQNVSNSDDIVGHLLSATSKINHQAYRDIEIDIDGVRVKDLTPEEIHSLYRGEQLSVFGHYFKPGKAKVTLKAKIGERSQEYKTSVELPAQADQNPELERLWAFSAIADMQGRMEYLGEKDADMEQAIEDIAVEYGLLTDYTSLLVVEEDVFQQLGIDRNNKLRVEKEQQARQSRKQAAPGSNRADQAEPMFSSPAPTHSSGGGGSFGIIALVVLGGLAGIRRRVSNA